MSDKTIGLEQIPVIKELVEGAIAEVIAPIKADIADITPQILPPNAKVVYCDGDHDEVKLQAAIDELAEAGGGVVYPVGECVITAENTVAATEENAVRVGNNIYAIAPAMPTRCKTASVRLYDNVTIDGTFCNSMELSVTSVKEPQNITFFALPYGGKLKNLNATMTFAADALKKKCPFTLLGENATVEDCTFTNLWGSNTGMAGSGVANAFIILVNSTIENCTIDRPFTRGTSTNSRSMVMKDCHVRNVEYTNSSEGDTGGGLQRKGIVTISGDIDTVRVTNSEICRLDIIGDTPARNITLDNLSVYYSYIDMRNVNGVTMTDITSMTGSALRMTDIINIQGNDISFAYSSIKGCFNNVRLTNIYYIGSDNGIFDLSDAIVTNCKLMVSPLQPDISSFALIGLGTNGNGDAIIKNNITNMPTLTTGTATRSIIDDNITATAMLAGTVTLTSNSESGFIEGARITATAADGDVQGANMSDIGQVVHLWQKSADGETWETVQDGRNTYTLKGDEGYIRCGVYDEYGFYAGAVYSDAYAVTGTTEEE